MHVYPYMHACISIHACPYMHVHTCMHVCMQMLTFSLCIHACWDEEGVARVAHKMCMVVFKYLRTHIYIHAYINTYTHTCTVADCLYMRGGKRGRKEAYRYRYFIAHIHMRVHCYTQVYVHRYTQVYVHRYMLYTCICYIHVYGIHMYMLCTCICYTHVYIIHMYMMYAFTS